MKKTALLLILTLIGMLLISGCSTSQQQSMTCGNGICELDEAESCPEDCPDIDNDNECRDGEEQICIGNAAYGRDDGSDGPREGEYSPHANAHQHRGVLIICRSSHGNADFGILEEEEKRDDKREGAAEYPHLDWS